MTKKQSTLPEYMEEKTVATMNVGDTGYVYPWAIFPEEDRLLYINGDVRLYQRSEGISYVLIKRTRDGVDVQESTIGKYKFRLDFGNMHEDNIGPTPFPVPVSLVKEIKLEGDNDAH